MNILFERVTNVKLHHLFTRNLVNYDSFLEKILECFERKENFFIFADFYPLKNTLNLDDLNRLLLLKWLQEVFNVHVIIQLKDNHVLVRDEINLASAGDAKQVKLNLGKAYASKYNLNEDETKRMMSNLADKQGNVKENFRTLLMDMISLDCIKEIISLDFNPDKTFICRNLEYFGSEKSYVECTIRAGALITIDHALKYYQLTDSDSIQAMSLASKDVASLFSKSYPNFFNNESNIRCLTIPGNSSIFHSSTVISSSPLRATPSLLACKIAPSLHFPSPATIQTNIVPSLNGSVGMSTMNPLSCIFLSDTDKNIKDKINKVAFSGGKDNVEEHRRLGGNCDVDVSYQYLRFFMNDESRLEEIRRQYSSGELLTGHLKQEVIKVLTDLVGGIREKAKKIEEKTVHQFMNINRPLLDLSKKTVVGEVFDKEPEASPRESTVVIDSDEAKEQVPEESGGDVVTPWEVKGDADTGIDYDKLIEKYGSSKITQDLVDRFERVTGKKAHHLLRRGMFYSHREFNEILDSFEKGEKFFLYTGRGPSSEALHLGHLIPFIFTKWLQEIFDVPLVIQMTDDEKFLMRNIDINEVQRLAIENAKDIIAIGFDLSKTFIFRDLEYLGQEPAFFQTAFRIGSKVTFNQIKAIFGFSKSDSVEKVSFPSTQAAPSFSCSFPAIFGNHTKLKSLIPCAIDQDPYFRMTRDVAPRLDMPKPALIHSKFFPALQGNQTKMNASDPNSAIFMTDSTASIINKINNHAFTLDSDRKSKLSAEEICQRDICYLYLTFFMEDDERLETLRQDFVSGNIDGTHLKKELINVLVPLVEGHIAKRRSVTDDVVHSFMIPRSLNF